MSVKTYDPSQVAIIIGGRIIKSWNTVTVTRDEDGLNLVRQLRSEEKWRGMPVVAITAHAFVTDREEALNAGCNDFITKPVSRSTLIEKIVQYF